MLLDGVSVDDRIVRQLAALVERPLGHKLEQALFFSARVVALTSREREAVLTAFERLPWEYEDVRARFLAAESASFTQPLRDETPDGSCRRENTRTVDEDGRGGVSRTSPCGRASDTVQP